MMTDPFHVLQSFNASNQDKTKNEGLFYSLPALEAAGVGPISRLPRSIRVVLESVLRNCDGKKVTEKDVRNLANWNAKKPLNEEIPFVVARIVLQDFTGVPLLVDLAAMRTAMANLGGNPKTIEPLVPVDLVVDHSIQVDFAGSALALQLNMDMEFTRNRERYEFLKWGQQAFKTFGVVPPGIGIVHQVNLEYLAKGVLHTAKGTQAGVKGDKQVYYPDTLVGTDSHTTMINGLGVVGWGVGGIEAEAGMLGQPVYFLTPEVVGVYLTGALREGVTATDLALHITQMLRAAKVVGKFVEFYGKGAASLTLPDRATIGNMAPEYGATMGYFPVDQETINYMRFTGRDEQTCIAFENYFRAQEMFGMPEKGEIEYSVDLELDLSEVQPSVSGPKRPQDRLNLPELKSTFDSLLTKAVTDGGYAKKGEVYKRFQIHLNGLDVSALEAAEAHEEASSQVPAFTDAADANGVLHEKSFVSESYREMITNRPEPTPASIIEREVKAFEKADPAHHNVDCALGNGSVVIAAITSCTNTSNPSVMLAAGLLAKKAVERGLKVNPVVKTSLAPGSRVVSDYLEKSGLQPYLDQLGFQVVGYGCTTCIGNSGPLPSEIEDAVQEHDLVTASVLSGNRNFEARIHQNVKANFLMSPPLVVAFALAGRVDLDITREALGKDKNGKEVFLKDIWPSLSEVRDVMSSALQPEAFHKFYSDFAAQNPKWNDIQSSKGEVYAWNEKSDYIHEPPFFANFQLEPGTIKEVRNARALGIFGDSVTTDHISPAGAIKATSPAGRYLVSRGVKADDFNSYGSRRGNDLVMTRGTFANVRIKNLMVPGVEGGVTKYYPGGETLSIFEASEKYRHNGTPLVIFAGEEYGTGSSRDWAAKGTQLLGVKAVIASSFERIHRSNLVGMGVLPLQFPEGVNAKKLQLDGSETFDLIGLSEEIKPGEPVTLVIHRANQKEGTQPETVQLCSRIDTAVEVDYYRHGGILPYVLRELWHKQTVAH